MYIISKTQICVYVPNALRRSWSCLTQIWYIASLKPHTTFHNVTQVYLHSTSSLAYILIERGREILDIRLDHSEVWQLFFVVGAGIR